MPTYRQPGLLPLYTQYFHLSARPFSISPDPALLFNSYCHQEGLAHLRYGIEVGGGFVVLTGEVGTGKTLLCYCLLNHLPENVDLALILNPCLSAVELIASICDELNIAYSHKRISLKYLIDVLNEYLLVAHAQGRSTVVMIDEAQNLGLPVLEQIRLLTNLETSTAKLLQIILVGQPELQELLKRPDLRQLNQRITARFHLRALSLDETTEYIHYRMRKCQGEADVFKAAAIARIYKHSDGIPRLINKLCDRSLLGAYTLGEKSISPKIVDAAAKEMQLFTDKQADFKWASFLLLVPIVLMALNARYHWYEFSKLEPKPQIQAAPELPPSDTKVETLAGLSGRGNLTLSAALENTFQYHHLVWSIQQPMNCETIVQLNIHCLADRANLKAILELQRPVILELESGTVAKQFVLLVGLQGKYAVIFAEHEISIPLVDLLRNWNGYYLALWTPPMAGAIAIAPFHSSPGVEWLKQLLEPDNQNNKYPKFYGKSLLAKVIAFQKENNLVADGVVGGRTIIFLQNRFQAEQFLRLKVSD